jgi:hypothetical protein
MSLQQQQHSTWTPLEREDWINECMNTNEERIVRDGFIGNLMLKQIDNANDNEDPRRNFVTSCLAKTLYGNHPLIKRLSLCFYKSLMLKMEQNSFLTLMYRRKNFVVMIKGSNAYKILLRHVSHDIEYSDLDIIMFINPHLEDDLFEQIRSSLVILVSQVMSRYKKDLDTTLFTSDEMMEESILKKNFVNDFKEYYKELVKEYNETGYKILTPFESKKVRNFCSKRSFIITNSTQEDHVVRVEIPHMNKCEFIPLKKTPLVFSYNKTIEFKRDIEGEYIAKFDLLRLRLNNMIVPEEDTLEQDDDIDTVSINGSVYEDVEDIYYDFKKCRVVPADFIDVSIPYKNDSELLDFWNSGGYKRCYEIYDRFIGTNLMIPNVNECIRDLSNMLHVYTNSHMKTEKRQKRLDMFKQLDENRKKQWELEQTGTTSHI